MMDDLQKYREISLDFRRTSSNMLNTKYNDGLLYLIRFKDFIDKNNVVFNILESVWSDVPTGFNDEFVLKDESSGWNYFSIPVEEAKHLKLCYDFLTKIVEEDTDLSRLSREFLLTSSKKYDDNIREFLRKAFKPLVDYINDRLSKKIMELTGVNQYMSRVTQNIENNYGTASVLGAGNISSVNNISMETESIRILCSDILKSLEELNIVSDNDKEIIIDDIDTIQSEIFLDNPRGIKVKKAWASIQKFLTKIPSGIGVALQLTELCEKLSTFFP